MDADFSKYHADLAALATKHPKSALALIDLFDTLIKRGAKPDWAFTQIKNNYTAHRGGR